MWMILSLQHSQANSRVASAETHNQGGRRAEIVFWFLRCARLIKKYDIFIPEGLHLKICNKFAPTLDTAFYPQKIGFFLFVAIATKPNIAFAVSRLSQFNQQPGQKHHNMAD